MDDQKPTVIYDGECALCRSFVARRKAEDTDDVLSLVRSDSLEEDDPARSLREIRFRDEAGNLFGNIDALAEIFSRTGRHRLLVRLLRWKPARPVLKFCYRRFAAHRHLLSWLLQKLKKI